MQLLRVARELHPMAVRGMLSEHGAAPDLCVLPEEAAMSFERTGSTRDKALKISVIVHSADVLLV